MYPRILYPFLRYRGAVEQLGPPFLILCLVALFGWLAYRRHRVRIGRPMSPRRQLLSVAFIIYLVGLATLTLAPGHSSRARQAQLQTEPDAGIELQPNLAALTCSAGNRPTVSRDAGFCRDNALGNVLAFLPLGFLLPLVFVRLRFWQGLLIAIGLSSSIELTQYVTRAWAHRSADVNDVILNSVGALLGLTLLSLLQLRDGDHNSVPQR